ncbi:hypothetical protein QO003_001970 [Arthrobacter silviterrae]|uniref:Tripartite tricarboxylate transporter permease n=1 Tax=Arthrobacter silviterrae TaxID=2026658 RepID=A0ABX0DFV3_9MICC|nr:MULTISPECIES: tripartite tricarboxylate transporter permease [Arthrobacter]MCU6479231.1 hypothetical protein [Arthrobacter sp. A2-55]MDQ0277667.1 hypothetical protein [Arthrobacter silviterrae]NGN84264.1 tripartite tricarboxylate transporter permease [Arthrobacter silviterrae]
MTHLAPQQPDEPYEPHHNNLVRDRKRMLSNYGPYSYARGVYVNGAETPLKPRNIRIQSSIPIVFAIGTIIASIWLWASGGDFSGVLLMFGFAAVCLLMSWIGFRTARLREKWEREYPDLAKNIKY